MAFLYIDRLKGDFQRNDHCIQRKNIHGKWSPQILAKHLGSLKFDQWCITKEIQDKSVSMHFVPKVPKIFTIGLRLHHKNTDEKRVLPKSSNVASLVNFLKEYLNFVLRFRNYMRILWKSNPNGSCNNPNILSLTFIKSIIAKYSERLRNKYTSVQKTDCILLRYKNGEISDDTLHEFQLLTSQSSKLKLSEKHFIDHCQHNNNNNNDTKEESYNCNNDTTASKPTESTLKEENNSPRNTCTRYKESIVKTKRNVSIQTLSKSKLQQIRSRKKEEKNQKGNITRVSSSKDIETIFTANRVDFNEKRCKTDREFFDAATRKKQKCKKHRKTSKKEKKPSIDDYKKKTGTSNDNLKMIYHKHTNKIDNNTAWLMEEENDQFQSDLTNDRTKVIGELSKDENYTENSEKILVENSVIIKANNSWNSQNYILEDKTSELMILGNVKKRLEEDYDDYFSLNDVDIENDIFFNSETPDDIVHVDQVVQSKPTRSDNSMLKKRSSKMQKETKQDLIKQSIRTSLTCTSSICFSNSNHSQSSYHTTLKDQECSPSSSIEYCTASNVSLSKFRSSNNSNNNSFNTLFRNYSMDNNSDRRECFSNDEDEETLMDSSYTLCCYRRNSTSKLITKSLDSGILTDCSRGHVHVASETNENDDGSLYVKKIDLLPTYDFNTDSSYSDESLNRRVDAAVNKFTENLILTERRARSKLKRMENPEWYVLD
ncbi:hypothetical protein ANTRET_LOCUS139 [Anthophora retusa]